MGNNNIQHLLFLLEKKHMFAGYHYLINLPPETSVPQKQKLKTELKGKIDTAKKLTADINTILKDGDYPKALAQLKKAQSLVHDFPNIQTDIDFITASITTMEKNLKEAKKLAAKGHRQRVNSLLKTAQEIDKHNNGITEIERALSSSRRKKSFKIILGAALSLILPLVYFSFEQITLQQAHGLLQRAQLHTRQGNYQQAQTIITQMDERLRFVRILGQSEKIHLQSVAAAALDQKGYTNAKKTATNVTQDSGNKRYIESLLQQAQVLVELQDTEGALTLYADALAFSDSNIHVSAETIQEIQTKRALAIDIMDQKRRRLAKIKLTGMIDTADELFRRDSWLNASVAYKNGLRFADNNDLDDLSEVAFMQQKYVTATINYNIEDAEVAYNQNRYTDATIAFQKCLHFMGQANLEGNTLYVNLTQKLQRVKQKQFMVQLAKLIHNGDELYAEREFELSLDNYNLSLALLTTDKAEIIGDKADVLRLKIGKKIARTEEIILIYNQTKKLTAMYQKILRRNFNLSRNIHFNHPEVTFLGNKNNHLIYTVSAFGAKSKSATAIKYEIDYKFNLNTGKWDVNDIRLEV